LSIYKVIQTLAKNTDKVNMLTEASGVVTLENAMEKQSANDLFMQNNESLTK